MTTAAASTEGVEFRAGATDVSERRRSGISRGPLLDIAIAPDIAGTNWSADSAARIGALTTIAEIAGDARLAAAYPGLVAAAGNLATPQIRHLATLGGNLAQRSRCWYYRSPREICLKKGGTNCPARSGNHLYGVAFDLGPCVAPHPSTMAAALLAYEARIHTNLRRGLTVRQLLGDGSNGAADHSLESGEMIENIEFAPPLANERAKYKRAISRAYAEWPLVEICARAVITGGSFQFIRVAAGGVAPVPLRLLAAEAALQGAVANATNIANAARQAAIGASPLRMTAYKLDLLIGLAQDILEQLAG